MGEIVKMVCRGCGYAWQCRTGCGINHAKLSSVSGYFREEDQKDILSRMEGQKFPLFSFAYRAAYCEHCHDIVSVPVMQLPEQKIEYIGSCSGCEAIVKPEQLKENLICPICRSKEFDVQKEGNWD